MLPGLLAVVPADHEQARQAIAATWDRPGPVYYRLGNNEVLTVDGLDGRYEGERPVAVRPGSDLLILVTGPLAAAAVEAADALHGEGLHCAVAVVAALGDGTAAALLPLLRRHRAVLTVESHYVTGGLGSLVAEASADHGLGLRIERLGVRPEHDRLLADRAHLYRNFGLDGEGIRTAASRLARAGTSAC